MTAPRASRGPMTWNRGDPEPGPHMTRVVTAPRFGRLDDWRRVTARGPDYRWFNGDRVRTWAMLHNRGVVMNPARRTHLRSAYRRKNRG